MFKIDKNPLTPREDEIYDMLCEGLSPKEIAEKLEISFNTVKALERRIYRKFNLKGIMDLLVQEIIKYKESY